MPFSIEIKNLSKSFHDHVVIRDLNLSIREGEIVVFQGPSGIGKSTFLRCLTYLEPFEKGNIQIGDLHLHSGMDLHKEKNVIQSVRENMGFVFQFFNLFPHLSVLENLMLAPIKVLKQNPEETRQEALLLLNRVGLQNKAGAYPSSLSGGQRQRIAIARALAMHPKAVLFDEPTSSLDPEMKTEIVRVIEEFTHEGLTMLIVTHEPAFIEKIATRIIKFGPQCTVESDQYKVMSA